MNDILDFSKYFNIYSVDSDYPWSYLRRIDLFNLDVETLDTYARLRMIVDLLSGMTDKYAVSLYQQLSGQKLK